MTVGKILKIATWIPTRSRLLLRFYAAESHILPRSFQEKDDQLTSDSDDQSEDDDEYGYSFYGNIMSGLAELQ